MKHHDERGAGHPQGPEQRDAAQDTGPRGRGCLGGPHGRGGRGDHGGRGGRRPFDYGALRLLILAMIAETPQHGYQLIKAIEDRSQGRYVPSPGVIYPTLAWLEDMGFARPDSTGAGRKAYHITAAGEAFVAANRAVVDGLLARDLARDLDESADPIRAAMHEVKSALRARLGTGDLPDADRKAIAAALSEVAARIRAVEGAMPPSENTAQTDEARPMDQTPTDPNAEQILTRHRFDVRRRTLTVADKHHLTPHMIRIVLTGEDLADFTSLGADDHVKLFFDTGADKPEMRDYTPRAFDRAARRLTLDFAVHDAGPATRWALGAQPGDTLTIGGPRGSAVVTAAFDWWLLIGDETALPAMGRWVEELPEGAQVTTLGFVTGAAEEQTFDTRATHRALWRHRPEAAAADPALALAAVAGLDLPEGRGFIWIAAEARVARALRDHFVTGRAHPRAWTKAAGYWMQGQADAHDKLMD